jgi:hypothetical protein
VETVLKIRESKPITYTDTTSLYQLLGTSTYIKLANLLVVFFPVAIASSVLGFAAFDELIDIIKLFFCWVDSIGQLHFHFNE